MRAPLNGTRAGVAAFTLAVLAGPAYTVDGYSHVRNVVSELAAQNTPGNVAMSIAFVALGAGIAADGVRAYTPRLAPFIAFGVFMALAGLFGHRPIGAGVPYLPWVDAAHSALASAAGVSITVATGWQALRPRPAAQRALAAALAVLCLALPLAMLALPAWQGAIQRAMYAMIFAWLWVFHPAKARE